MTISMTQILMYFRTQLIACMVVLFIVLMIQPSSFAASSTRQVISNMAVGEFSEEGSNVVQVTRSNLVQTTILPVYSVNLTANNSKNVIAGQTIYFNHTLSNTGNETDQYSFNLTNNTGDQYDLSSLLVFLDKDNDGVPDGAATTSYSLAAGESVGLIVAGTVPSDVTVNQTGLITLLVNSSNNASGTKANTDTAVVTNQSTLTVRKKFLQTSSANGDIVTVRLDYQNLSNIATGIVTFTDVLNTNLVYQSNHGENWNGVSVNPNEGNNDPTGINYSVTSNTVTAVLSSIPAKSSGYIEFKVQANKVNAGAISNTINVQYDHDNNSATVNMIDSSNIAILNIAPLYAVSINGSANNSNTSTTVVATSTVQGGEFVFNNYVWNTGNTTDRFNLTWSGSTFPTGSQIEFYRADGVTPLLDSNSDGIADTGELTSGNVLPVVIKVRLPSNYTVTADTTFEISAQAQSISNNNQKSNIKNQGTLRAITSAQLVDLTNSPENNAIGNANIDNAGAAWKTLTTSTTVNAIAGGQVVFPLLITHKGTATEYLLSANATTDFTQLTLPNGVSAVRFYTAQNSKDCSVLGTEIGKTRYLNDTESQLVCAVVAVKSLNNTLTTPIYFRVLSTSLVSDRNNPSQDLLKNAITIQSTNAVAQIEFMPNVRGQVTPLGTVIYSHTLKNNTDTDFSGDYSFIINNDQDVFNSTLFYDVNGNQIFDAGDLVIRSLNDLPNAKLAAKQQINLLLQVKNLVSNNIAQSNTTRIRLMSISTAQVIASISDVTLVNQVQLKLNKVQARDFNCDGIADESYTSNAMNIGKQDNGQGQCVLYKVTLTNSSATSLETAFTFRDMTPVYTILFQAPSCTACNSVASPAVGSTGAVSGTLSRVAANQSYDFIFGVRYVGQ